uniref:Replication protein A subunit n=1 Tax=Sinocyclocheilus rhinocerous TaxID=307959 RepID=A0A673JNE7_9TELE
VEYPFQNIRKIDGGNGLSRFRLMMSDGLHTMSSFMLSTQLNPMAEQNQLASNCVCMLKRSVTNVLKDGRRVVVILDMDVIKSADQMAGKIGDPTPYVEGESTFEMSNFMETYISYAHIKTFYILPSAQSFGKKPMAAPNTPGGSSKVVPIASLNPYQSKWTVRARVTNKSAIRTWSNSRGDGKLFSMELVDESGEIRATGFNNEVDKFYSLIEQGKVYYISKGTLKIANKQFSSLKNDYEMTLNGETTISPCEDSHDVPVVQCDFVSIADLECREKDTIVDVIGVCKNTEDVMRIMTKNSREVSKRNIQLMDMSGRIIQLTMWGSDAETFDGSGQPILAIKGARLSDFGGRSLSTLYSSTVMINPDIPETIRFKNEHLGHGDKVCHPHIKIEFPDFKYRLMLSANIADFGDNQWVICFQDSAETLLGQNSGYLGQLKDSNEPAFDEVFQHANFNTFVFRNRVKLETYNDESRIKVTVVDAKPVDHREYSKRLIINIRKLAAQ